MISSTDGVGGWARRVVSAAVSSAARAATGATAVVTSPADAGAGPAAKAPATKATQVKKATVKTPAKKSAVTAKRPAATTKRPAATTRKPAVAAKKAVTTAKPVATRKAATATKPATATKAAAPTTRATKAAAVTKGAAAKKPTSATKPAPAARLARAKPAPAKSAAAKVAPRSLKVREDETPWTAAELRVVRTELEQDIARLTTEIATAETGLHELLRDSGDGAGDDQADAGAKTFEREQEIALANNSREMLVQSSRALTAIDDGTYGICESCALPVGKMRLQAFPRATLCVSCKQRQERH